MMLETVNQEESREELEQHKDYEIDSSIRSNVDLARIEGIRSQEISPETVKLGFSDVKIFRNMIRKMNLKVIEAVDKVFDTSLNYIIIVKDDKIVYANKSFIELVDCEDFLSVYNKKFFSFIHQEDWNYLAENIGEMLTKSIGLDVRVSTMKGFLINVNFKAMYLDDGKHFSFILFGNKIYTKKDINSALYDTVTGLPSYYLFLDRLQMAINVENSKLPALKNQIAIVAINIDNLDTTLEDKTNILRSISEKMVLSFDKTHTVSVGLDTHFWIIIPKIKDEEHLREEIVKIVKIFENTVHNGLGEHDIATSIGVSVYPNAAQTPTKMIEVATKALEKARNDGGNKVVIYSD